MHKTSQITTLQISKDKKTSSLWQLPICVALTATLFVVTMPQFAYAKNETTKNHSIKSKSVKTDNQTIYHTLNNGLKVIIQPDHRAPLAMVQVWYQVGGADEPDDLLGISHVLEHMMFKGTVKVPDDQFKRINANFGGSLNALTNHNYTYYYQLFPKDYVALALELEADRMSNLHLRQQDFATEIEVVKEERRQRIEDNPQAQAFEHFRQIAYPSSRYRLPVIGYMQNLNQMNLSDVRKWYQTWYAPNNATVVIVGDVNPQQTLTQVQRYFGDIKSKQLPERNRLKESNQSGYRHEVKYASVHVPNLYMAWNVPSLATASSKNQAYVLDVLREVLDGGLSARIEKELVREQKIITTASANYEMLNRGDTIFSITAIPAEGVTLKQAEQAIIKLIDELKTSWIQPDELLRVQSSTLSKMIYAQDTLQGQAELIGKMQANNVNAKEVKNLYQKYDNIKAEDLQQVITQYFNDDNLASLYLLPMDQQPVFTQNHTQKNIQNESKSLSQNGVKQTQQNQQNNDVANTAKTQSTTSQSLKN